MYSWISLQQCDGWLSGHCLGKKKNHVSVLFSPDNAHSASYHKHQSGPQLPSERGVALCCFQVGPPWRVIEIISNIRSSILPCWHLSVVTVIMIIVAPCTLHSMTQIFFIDWQQHWKYDRTMNTGANAHGKRAVSTLKRATSDRLDLRWQLGFQWHGIGIELVLQVPRLFHNATVSQYDHFLLLHMYMYLLFETSPGWRGFFQLNFVGATELQCIYYLCRILISRPPRVIRRFKRRSC